MNYLIFDNDIYYESEGRIENAQKDKIADVFKGSIMESSVAIIDILQKQVAAPEKSPLKRDEIISASFTGEYVIQPDILKTKKFIRFIELGFLNSDYLE